MLSRRKLENTLFPSLLAASMLALGVALGLLMHHKPTSPSVPVERVVAGSRFVKVRKLLQEYYQVSKQKEKSIDSFVSFVVDPDNSPYSPERPVEPYIYGGELSFYFLSLPDRLESAQPVCIAYTGPFNTDEPILYRGILVLRETDLIVVVVQDHVVRKIFGPKKVKIAEPDFWWWPGYRIKLAIEEHRAKKE